MSSEKDLNRIKWQNKKKSKVNMNTFRKGTSLYKQYIELNKKDSTRKNTLGDYVVESRQANESQQFQEGGFISYLDGGGFSLDMDEVMQQGDVLYNSQGFNFEQLLEDAREDNLFGRRSWGLSQDFEYSQPVVVPDCQVLQVDLKSLGSALEGIPMHELLGIDYSYFDTSTQTLRGVSSSKRINSQQSISSSDEAVEEAIPVQLNSGELQGAQQLNSLGVEELCEQELRGNYQNEDAIKLKQQEGGLDNLLGSKLSGKQQNEDITRLKHQEDDLDALLGNDQLLDGDNLLTLNSSSTQSKRLKQQENGLEALLCSDLLTDDDNFTFKSSKVKTQVQRRQHMYGQNGLERPNENETSCDLDDELDRLLQL